jgi:hypothetical protein
MAGYAQRELLTAPERLVEKGRFNFGTFGDQFKTVNPLDAKNPLGPCAPRFFLDFRLKEWQAFQLGNERWFILVILYNAKVSALAQFIAYDKRSKKRYVFERMLSPWKVRIPGSIWSSSQCYEDDGCLIEMANYLGKGRFYINVKTKDCGTAPDMEGHFEMFHDQGVVEPMVVSIPFGVNRGMYSHKCLMPMQGTLHIEGERTAFVRGQSFALMDDHKGFYPYIMKYDWLTAAGYDEQKRLIGFNLTDNQSIDPGNYNENCLWANGRLNLLPPVSFSRPEGDMGEWRIKDNYGMVDLVFKPESAGEINMNWVLLKVRYRGPFGYCAGTVRDSSGAEVRIDDYFGMGEEKYLRG